MEGFSHLGASTDLSSSAKGPSDSTNGPSRYTKGPGGTVKGPIVVSPDSW